MTQRKAQRKKAKERSTYVATSLALSHDTIACALTPTARTTIDAVICLLRWHLSTVRVEK